jgi:GT2 family glycosyltransferase
VSELPLIYTVMRNHNAYDLTSVCIKSLRACSFQNMKIVVVDDGSRDGSGEKIAAEFDGVEVLTSSKYIEYCKGLNLGIRHALKEGAEYVFVVNNDTDNFSVNYFEKMVDAFSRKNNIALVGSLVYDYDGNKRSAGTAQTRLGVFVDTPTEGYMFSKKVLEDVGLFDEQLVRYFEDYDYFIRMRAKGYETYCTREVQFDHLGGGTSKKQIFTPNFYRVRNLIWFIKRYRKGEPFYWKYKNFRGFMKKHVDLTISLFKSAHFIRAVLVAGSIGFGLLVGATTKWDNCKYD